jgi:NAD(P)H dehydrogenase (quinone)
MILITGATGHLGESVIANLVKKVPASQVIAGVRDESKADSLRKYGINIRIGNYHQKETLSPAFRDVDKALLISSSDFMNRLEQHKNAIDAAKAEGVKQIVYTGVEMKDIKGSAPALKGLMIDHFQTEDYIKEKGLNYTFMRHTLYADMIPFYIGEKAVEQGIFFPAGDGKVPYATRADMGEAIANVLAGDGHDNKIYDISGEQSYSFTDIAKDLSAITGKTVSYKNPDVNEFMSSLKKAGTPDMVVNVLVAFAMGIKGGHFDVKTSDLKDLLGRKPTTVREYLQATFKR